MILNLVPGKITVKINAKDMIDFKSDILVVVIQTANLAVRFTPIAATTVEVIAIDPSKSLNTTDPTQAKAGYTTTKEQLDYLPV